VCCQRLLDFSRIDVDATGENEIRPPIGQVEEPVLVEPADISQGAPAAVIEGGGCFGRVVVVLEFRRALEPDLACFSAWSLGTVVVADVHGADHRKPD